MSGRLDMGMMQGYIDHLTAQPDSKTLDKVVECLTKKLYNTAKTCEKKWNKTVPVIQEVTQSMSNANKILQKYSSGNCSWEEWDTVRKDAAGVLCNKHHANTIKIWNDTLLSSDPKKIWEKNQLEGKL